jgi:hypothetical protein
MGTTMTNEARVDRGIRACPLAWWACVYLMGVPLIDGCFRWLLPETSLPIALVSVAFPAVAAAVVLEAIRKRLGDCGAILRSPLQRGALYALSVVVGLFVVYPALSVSRDITPALRVLGALGIGGVLGALGWHWRVDHRDGPVSLDGGTRALLWISRVPFVLLGVAGGLLLVVAVGEILYSRLGH